MTDGNFAYTDSSTLDLEVASPTGSDIESEAH